MKKTKKYFEYRSIPFAEGIFDVKVPKNAEIDITRVMSIHDLPSGVKTKARIQIVEQTQWTPKFLSYYYNSNNFKFVTEEFKILYFFDTQNLYIEDLATGEEIEIKNTDGIFTMGAILRSNNPIEYARILKEMM